jgi:hypothetical protein
MSPDRKRDQVLYLIRMEGQLDKSWSGWFSGLSITYTDGVSTLTGPVADQAALRGILSRLWDLNLTLLSVARIEPGAGRANAQEKDS